MNHDVKYYHARGARSTHDLVDQEDHGAAFDLVFLYEKKAPTCVGASFNARVETRGIEPLTS